MNWLLMAMFYNRFRSAVAIAAVCCTSLLRPPVWHTHDEALWNAQETHETKTISP